MPLRDLTVTTIFVHEIQSRRRVGRGKSSGDDMNVFESGSLLETKHIRESHMNVEALGSGGIRGNNVFTLPKMQRRHVRTLLAATYGRCHYMRQKVVVKDVKVDHS